MAHSLFEPAPRPLGEKLWRSMKRFNIGFHASQRQPLGSVRPAVSEPPQQEEHLDARGQQQLLESALAARPILAKKGRAS
ncbi:hypothetical protein [Labrenzia sp. OB1]|uniref:hypothetical protein n=1 Tax=Labrenzia sp. OB1 TaxID=1561204 RepID=UPI0007B2F9F6|nr:hypothetical protein [Labrenzia sp. OB1]KZM51220.1 hypothetical protein OA90_06095 [Labrenzia sp. OB1]